MTWIAVIVVGVGSFAFRAIPLILGPRLRLSRRTQDVLRHTGMGGITALLVISLLGIGTAGGTTTALSAVAAVAVATVVARRGRSMALVMLAGGAGYGVVEFAVQCSVWL